MAPERRLGNQQILSRYIGDVSITKRYKGDQLIWERGVLRDDFLYDGLLMNNGWSDLGSWGDYRLAAVDGASRIGIPDGLIVEIHRDGRARYNLNQIKDNGYIELQVRNKGNAGYVPIVNWTYVTDLFGWCNPSGSQTSGVGIRLREGRIFIVHRSGSTNNQLTECGVFGGGDRIRLRRSGSLFTMTRNGRFAGESDIPTAGSGSGFRSLVLRQDGSKDLLGPRRFSASLDYVEYG